MTDLNVQIPDSLYKQISSLAARENISSEQLVAIALSRQTAGNGYIQLCVSVDDIAKTIVFRCNP